MLTTAYFGPQSFPLENKIVGDFVSRIVWGGTDGVEKYCTMGVFDDKALVAGTIYHNWHPESGIIELTGGAITKRWLTRPVIRAMFYLPFDMLGCQMCVMRVSERNKSVLRILRSFGFDEVYIPRLRGRDEGEYIFTLTDDQWREHKVNRHKTTI